LATFNGKKIFFTGSSTITIEGDFMALYMVKASYAAEAIKSMVANPQDRSELISSLAAAAGGKLLGMYMAFGDDDVIGICEMPDDVSIASFSAAVSSGGAVTNFSTTQLLSMSDWVTACKGAKSLAAAYNPPGS